VRGNPQLEWASFTAVAPPVPRTFAVQDLITIIIREQSETSSRSNLETDRDLRLDAEPGDDRKRVEDDEQINKGLISKLIDGVKGL
jgi:hypothetical protein